MTSSLKEKQLIPGIANEYGKQILNLFHPFPKGASLILFGSRAKGNYREGSDIDLALQGPSMTQKDRTLWLLQYEDLNLPWKLDLVIFKEIEEPALIEHIRRVGIKLL